MADIRNRESFANGRWDWDAAGYSSAFPRKISPTDIDGMVEVGGRFLFIEQKEYHPDMGAPMFMPKGQRMALERLAALPKVTVLYIAGEKSEHAPWWMLNMGTGRIWDLRNEQDVDARRTILRSWLLVWSDERAAAAVAS